MSMRNSDFETAFLRAALAAGFFSAVADRFGFWGPPGSQHVAWGNMSHFFPYVAILNPWFPAALIPAIAWLATFAEIALGLFLLIGLQTRWAARLSGLLLFAFAFGMTAGTNIKSALDSSVFAASAGAFLLAKAPGFAWSIDSVIQTRSYSEANKRET
ncbi:MAG: DoxX family protein [Acidobacteriaceae bacterium]|nr:DoxX family protein [Acidobacteriaceae bacterium]MBV8571739.1 DoxX family protein [Acidobacteriaceae bacterium]